MTNQYTPPMRQSDEANKTQLELAKRQGETYEKALQHMAKKVADDGGEQRAGDYIVAYAVEKAEGMYHKNGGDLEWREPDGNAHIEISVRDGADGRFIPGLTVHVTLLTADGRELGSERLPMLWHPWLYHYGRNWQVPGDGEYTLRVRIEAPDFPRHDKENGERYAEDVEVTFSGVKMETGKG